MLTRWCSTVISASAAPSMAATPSSADRSMSSWLRREETPPVRISVVSLPAIWSTRILFWKANSTLMASAAVKLSSGAGPAAAAGAAGAVVGTAAGASVAGATGAAGTAGAVSSAAGSSSGSSKTGGWATSFSMTTSWSRSTLNTGTCTPRTSMLRSARLVRVGDAARPISTISSTLLMSSSWVSIHRTGEANCQLRSSIMRVRTRLFSSALSRSHLASRVEGTTSRMASMKSCVSSNGRATKLGTYLPTKASLSISCGKSSSSFSANAGTPGRSTAEWKGTSMPGIMTKALGWLVASLSAANPARVPATAYC